MARLKSESGYSLVEVAIAVGAGAVLALGVSQLFGWANKTTMEARQLAQIEVLRTTMLKSLESEAAWIKTIAQNPAMACLAKEATIPCGTTSAQPFVLRGSDGQVIYDAAKGVDFNGVPCDGFSDKNTSSSCPLRFNLTWKVVCQNTFCTTIVNAPLLGTKNLPVSMNLGRYSINDFVVPAYGQMCTQNTQQVFIYPKPGQTVTSNFTIPVYKKKLVVEVRGGGGGAGAIWGFGGVSRGQSGADTWFKDSGLTAKGGLGGAGPASGSILVCWPAWGPYGAGPLVGQDAPPSTPGLLPDNLPNTCEPANTNASTAGKGIPISYANGGKYSAGGTGSIGHILTGGAPCLWGAWNSEAGYAGGYRVQTFDPVSLPPGTNVPYQIGAGGIGAAGIAWFYMDYVGIIPTYNKGGNGADGMIKITWE